MSTVPKVSQGSDSAGLWFGNLGCKGGSVLHVNGGTPLVCDSNNTSLFLTFLSMANETILQKRKVRLNFEISKGLHLLLKQHAGFYGVSLSDYIHGFLKSSHSNKTYTSLVMGIIADADSDKKVKSAQENFKGGRSE